MKQEKQEQNGVGAQQEALTTYFQRWNTGDKTAADEIFRITYEELRRIAAAHARRERRDHTLPATAIVHEAYMKIFNEQDVHWRDRAHFLGAASRVMRHLLIDYARRRSRQKRRPEGGPTLFANGRAPATTLSMEDVLTVNESLTRLAAIDERKTRVVEAHFFGGMTINETAEYLSIPRSTVVRDLKLAKAWIYRDLGPKNAD